MSTKSCGTRDTSGSKDTGSDLDVSCKDLELIVGNVVKKHLDAFRMELKTEMKALIVEQLGSLDNRVRELEKRVQDLETDLNVKTEKLLQLESATDSITAAPKSDAFDLRPDLEAVKVMARAGSIAANDCEQYSRRQNIRIRGINIPEDANAMEFIAAWINKNLDHPNITPDDIAAAHPQCTGKSNSTHESNASSASTVLVRFHRKDVRDSVIAARKVLKKSGVSISDDLTSLNAQLLKRLQSSDRLLGAWSWKGKIFAKLSDTKSVVARPYQTIDELFCKMDHS